MRLLLHVCCGPCAAYPVKALKQGGIYTEAVFFNPNIHPFLEYKERLKSAKLICQNEDIRFSELDGYGLESFIKKTVDCYNRCYECYYMRLNKIAEYASMNNFDSFTTTLLVSPYQKHELLIELGNQLAEKFDISFYYRDFRVGFREGQQIARDHGLYMQKYCGCIYSEYERYMRK